MTEIYPSPSSKEFIDDIKSVERMGRELVSLIEEKKPLEELIAFKDQCDAVLITLDAYANALLSTDTENTEYIKAVGDVENAAVMYQQAEDVFLRSVAKRKDEFNSPVLKPWRKYLEDILVEESHLMSPEEESLAAELSRSGSSAWERLMATVTSTIAKDGKTLTELRLLASDGDRTVRKSAYENEIALLKEHKVAIAGALNGVKGTVLSLEKRRGWKDPVDRALFSSAIDHQILDSLIAALEPSLPVFQDYFHTKARLLGIDKMDFYDLFAPVGNSEKSYSYDEAREIVVSSYSSFSPEMGAFARYAFEHNWIDAEPRPGKSGGAYDTSFPKVGVSRVFCNFDGSYDSVSTLAHELGHAFHDSVVKDLPPSLSTYPMTLAETASIFGEMLVFDHVLENSEGDEKLAVIESFVQSAAQVIVDIYSRFLFEKSVFEERKNGEISADRFSELMLSAQEKAYGDAIGIKHPYMWAVKSHYYSASLSYYNYPYAFGELFALSLYSRKNEKNFFTVYKNVLLNTGMKSAAECAAVAGSDITSSSFWESGISLIAEYAERLKSWL